MDVREQMNHMACDHEIALLRQTIVELEAELAEAHRERDEARKPHGIYIWTDTGWQVDKSQVDPVW